MNDSKARGADENASSGSIDCACAVRAERKTSSYWPPPPKICGNRRS